MPIKPANRARYPSNWSTEIRPAMLLRANNCCERCFVPNRTRVARIKFEGDHFWAYHDGDYSYGRNADTGEYVDAIEDDVGELIAVVEIVLTIAHLQDPDPANCDPANLAAFCQRCHNLYDRDMRQRNATATRTARKLEAIAADPTDLFSGARGAA